jgi:hypothetical protein
VHLVSPLLQAFASLERSDLLASQATITAQAQPAYPHLLLNVSKNLD